MSRRTVIIAGVVVAVLATLFLVFFVIQGDPVKPQVEAAKADRIAPTLEVNSAPPRTLEPYAGLGAWVDVFDYSPPYAGANPPLAAVDVDEMAAASVSTLFLQAARIDDRTPTGLEDPWLLAEWVLRGHGAGLDVVGWYLPKWSDDGADLDRILAVAEFEVLGQRFDGVAVDIEWTGEELDDATRSQRLVGLSANAATALGDDPLGAIVLPPVLIEVVNEDYWPQFPWREIAPFYDAWLPMSYWSFRSGEYDDGYAYNEESTRRLRRNLGDAQALVHGIGGIGALDGVDDPLDPEEPLASIDQLDSFVESLRDTGSVGGSIYDWNTTEPAARQRMAELFAVPLTGPSPSP